MLGIDAVEVSLTVDSRVHPEILKSHGDFREIDSVFYRDCYHGGKMMFDEEKDFLFCECLICQKNGH